MKVSGTTTSRITTPAVTAASNRVTTTTGKTTTSKQVGTPAVVAMNNVKTTNSGTTATRITTPAVVAGHVTTIGSSGSAKRVGTPAVTTYAATNGTSRTLSTPAVPRDAAALQAARGTLTKNLTAPKAEENSFMDGVHIALDVAGFVPVVGTVADLANGIIYAAEGDWLNAGISTAAIFVDAATGARVVTNAAQNVIGATMTRVVREGAEETVERVGRETAENVAERIGREVGEGGTVPDFYVGPNGKILPGQYKNWIGTNRQGELLEQAENPQLRNAIKESYRGNSFIGDGGTADVIRFEQQTGIMLGKNGGSHVQKGTDMAKYIEKKL